MDATAKKVTKIVDELICYFLQMGSDDVRIDLKRDAEGYTLTLDSSYDKDCHKQIRDLDKFLNVQERNEGIEDVYWGLAGMGGEGFDSELHLVGQMIDDVKMDVKDRTVRLVIKKYFNDKHL